MGSFASWAEFGTDNDNSSQSVCGKLPHGCKLQYRLMFGLNAGMETVLWMSN